MPIEYFHGIDLGNEVSQKIISLVRRMKKNDQEILVEYLIRMEEMMKINDQIENNPPSIEADQIKIIREFYNTLEPYLNLFDAMRNNTREMRNKLEKVLEI